MPVRFYMDEHVPKAITLGSGFAVSTFSQPRRTDVKEIPILNFSTALACSGEFYSPSTRIFFQRPPPGNVPVSRFPELYMLIRLQSPSVCAYTISLSSARQVSPLILRTE